MSTDLIYGPSNVIGPLFQAMHLILPCRIIVVMRRFMKAIKAENLNALAVHIAEYQQRRSAVFA
jgi:hypothetical protein